MPVFFAGRNDNDITGGNLYFFAVGGNNTLSGGDKQDLLAVVGMKLVANAFAKINDIEIKLLALGQ